MSQLKLYIASSIDNYIAMPNGNIDWLTSLPAPKNGDYGYGELLNSIESTIMGRHTYEEILGFGVEWPYPNFQTYVVTSNQELSITTPKTQIIDSNELVALIQQLKQNNKKDIWLIGGGQLIVFCLEHQLIDQMILTKVPIILGKGIPLFPPQPTKSNWELTKTEAFDTGLVNLTYQLKND